MAGSKIDMSDGDKAPAKTYPVKENPDHGFTKTAAGDAADHARQDADDGDKKVSITWLGDGSDAEENAWNGIVFPKGKAVKVDDSRMIEKARGNRFFKVKG